MEAWQYPNTTDWAEFPFSIGDLQFVAKIDKSSSLYGRILETFGVDVFATLNAGFVSEALYKAGAKTREEIERALYTINEYATEAVLVLA